MVARWPETAVALEEVLADADRLLLQRIGMAADDGGRSGSSGSGGGGGGSGGSGGLFRGDGGAGARNESERHHLRASHHSGGNGHDGRSDGRHQGNGTEGAGKVGGRLDSPPRPGQGHGHGHGGAMDRLRAGKAAAAAAAAAVARGAVRGVGQARAVAEKARSKFREHGGLGDFGGGGGGHHRASVAGPDEGFVPSELAAALTALKAMVGSSSDAIYALRLPTCRLPPRHDPSRPGFNTRNER